MLSHAALWIAIDRLAAREKISVSALARRAGLDPTSFNVSKRRHGQRLRWPSTENLMQLLRVTSTSIDDFVALAPGAPRRPTSFKVPLLSPDRPGALLSLPELDDSRLCALVVAACHSPCPYPRGTILLLQPTTNPRRSATLVLETRTRKIRIGVMQSQDSHALHVASHGKKMEKIARADIIKCFTVVWTRQGSV